ncbi:spondin-2-like [Latimeria chalumnae]|uniref:spondin-2-like n=1 Tax=Latimeria chalumnae TaxID=7897 RepID=UPI0006D913B5|nr:PREDICTED: spondin-2-like [Latimeria chalumnae]|eukprot:XP_014347395.1 PREDICTED: spondin-2-like [Latimeria chalumnae]
MLLRPSAFHSLLCLLFFLTGWPSSDGARSCHPASWANYSLTFFAEWNPVSFPKQYPTHRPPAQWSELFGCVHDSHFILWEEGALASPAVKVFAEEGKSVLLTQDAQSTEGAISGCFRADPIPSGEGSTSAIFRVEPAHTLVSVIVKIIPSPDWFVGIERLNLCKDSQWKKMVSCNLFPWDTGTDSGFTFSSPNFATEPQEPIFQITAKSPSHPANSFHYPRLETLPRMGYLELRLVAEGPWGTEAEPADGGVQYDLLVDNSMRAANDTELDRQEENEIDDGVNSTIPEEEENRTGVTPTLGVNATPLDCEVSDWSSWGLCSHACGRGIRQRTRYVTLQPANHGEPCPSLLIEEECEGSRCPLEKEASSPPSAGDTVEVNAVTVHLENATVQEAVNQTGYLMGSHAFGTAEPGSPSPVLSANPDLPSGENMSTEALLGQDDETENQGRSGRTHHASNEISASSSDSCETETRGP